MHSKEKKSVSAEKGSVIPAEPNSLAEPNVQSVTIRRSIHSNILISSRPYKLSITVFIRFQRTKAKTKRSFEILLG